MECREVETRLAEYSAGLLPPRQGAAIASHLERCSACAREWKSFQGVLGLVGQYAALEPPPGLWNGIYNRIVTEAPEPAARSWWQRLWGLSAPDTTARPERRGARVMGPAIATAVLAGVVWLYQGETRAPGQPDREIVVAVREHALASSDALFADRAGLESLAVLASFEASPASHVNHRQ